MTEKEVMDIFQGYKNPENPVELEDISFRFLCDSCYIEKVNPGTMEFLGYDHDEAGEKELMKMVQNLWHNMSEVEDNGITMEPQIVNRKEIIKRTFDGYQFFKVLLKIGTPTQITWFIYSAIYRFMMDDNERHIREIHSYDITGERNV